MSRRLLSALIITTLLLFAFRPPAAHAHTQTFTVTVSQYGFESVVDYQLDVEAGHPVVLTFTYADMDMTDDNPHEIKIKGPGVDDLPTVTVSREKPTATIDFTPKATGTLHFVCVVPCRGMENLVGGQIKVLRPKATGASVALALDLSPREDGSVLARATLHDARGSPLVDAPVAFVLHTSVGGDLVLGNPKTIDNGSAVLKIPATGAESVRVTASFDGGNGLAYAETSQELALSVPAMAHPLDPLSTPTAPPALALALLVVLGGVWATYSFVVFQIIRIRLDEKKSG